MKLSLRGIVSKPLLENSSPAFPEGIAAIYCIW